MCCLLCTAWLICFVSLANVVDVCRAFGVAGCVLCVVVVCVLAVCWLLVVGLCCWLLVVCCLSGVVLFLILIVVCCSSWSVRCVLFVALRERCVLASMTFGLV